MEPSGIKKRSVTIDGRKTSISLEDEFWFIAKDIAQRRAVTVGELIEQENRSRLRGNLSSCIRRLVLQELHDRITRADAELLRLKAH
jgi:predicted DNA-binding ribbon-helix-helix protein